jgi:hypothetical protein
LKSTFSIDSTDHRSSIGLSVIEANLSQNRRALNALAPYWKKEEELALISEENIPKYMAKPWLSNRQLSAGFRTMLTAHRGVGGG